MIKPVKAFAAPYTLAPTIAKNVSSCATSQQMPAVDSETLAKLCIAISGAMLLRDTRPSEVVLLLSQKWYK